MCRTLWSVSSEFQASLAKPSIRAQAVASIDVAEIGGNVSRPRAADDFAAIRSRLEELRRERFCPRAADDFVAIRARLIELRRERALSRAINARGAEAHRPLTPGSWQDGS